MKISKATWNKYKDKLAAVSEKASRDMSDFIERLGGYDVDPDAVVRYAYALATKYGEAAAAAACDMYDAVASASGAGVPYAEPAATATYGETAKAVRGTANNTSSRVIPATISRLVKQAGADTTMKNVRRDGAEFAWIPAGDSCAFCLTIASRGWQPASKAVLNGDHAEHIHANCDCQFAIRFDRKTNVEGYNPDELLEAYQDAEGQSPKDKINYLRRKNYAANKDTINTQKRAAYAEREQRSLPSALEFRYNTDTGFLPKDTAIDGVMTIAGKGSNNELRDRKRLAAVYGGDVLDWSKRVGIVQSDKYRFDVHWYEKDGQIYEHKIKEVKEKK